MKKIILLTAMALVTLSGSAQTVTPDSEGMNLNAQEWTRDVVMGWNLGNALESSGGETNWGNPKTTQAMVKAVADAGFNAIRIPVRWTEQLADAENMVVKDTWLARVKEVVDWALAEGMYVIINTHHEEWLDRNPFYSQQVENNRKLAALWTCIATYFRDYGEKLIFAGTNETTVNWSAPNAEQQAVQNSYNQTFVDAVRDTGGKNYYRNLVVQTFACSPYHGLNGFTIPTDKVEGRLSVEFHYYDPYEYCGNCTYYYWGEAYKDKGRILASSTESTITNLFDRITNTWMQKGLGVVMGEYGVANHYTNDDKQTQQENMQYYLKCVTGEARKHGFAAFVWDNNAFNNGPENFGIFMRWQNMKVGNTYFLKGITEGAGTEYVEPEYQGDDDTGEGVTFWEGDAVLDWGNGLQLTVPASLFEGKGNDVKLVLSYTQDYTDYDDIQLFYGDWSALVPFNVSGSSFSGDFIPSNYYYTGSGTSHVTAFSFNEETLAIILQKGIVIQGHGIRLNKVSIATPTGISAVVVDDTNASPIHTLDGKRVARTLPGHLYIQHGRKFIAR
ncbi:MAG: glycoside hydrolase family 5 protein [Prevotella sp.]|nr:glycoside hydrolase family 5 protein [Prevotella sp.]MBO4658610.1 glycoside hydrolase family 5 protein [Prevotella sp.]